MLKNKTCSEQQRVREALLLQHRENKEELLLPPGPSGSRPGEHQRLELGFVFRTSTPSTRLLLFLYYSRFINILYNCLLFHCNDLSVMFHSIALHTHLHTSALYSKYTPFFLHLSFISLRFYFYSIFVLNSVLCP